MIRPPVRLSACPLVRLSTCPLVRLSARPPVRSSARPLVRLSARPRYARQNLSNFLIDGHLQNNILHIFAL